MAKFLKILFLTIIWTQLSWASERVIKFEDFVHFSNVQKIETLKLVHNYLIQYEQLNIEDIKNDKVKKKYQTYLKIFNFFISTAYADNDQDLSRNNLATEELCFYAGWISIRTVRNGQSICNHPSRLKNLLSNRYSGISSRNRTLVNQISNRYRASTQRAPINFNVSSSGEFSFQQNTSNSCNSSGDDIICNPTFFGYKSGSSICVGGNKDLGLNSSLLCNQALNLIEEQNPEEYQVTIQGILNNATGANKSEFFQILDTMYDTCLCGRDATGPENRGHFQGSIDPSYAEVMFNQRACFGIINQTQHIQTALNQLPRNSAVCSSFDQQILNNNTDGIDWLNYLNEAHKKLQEQDIDEKLAQVIELRKSSLNRSLSEAQRDQIRLDEAELISEMREQHFEEYIEAGLCPSPNQDNNQGGSLELGSNPQTNPQTETEIVSIEGVGNNSRDPDASTGTEGPSGDNPLGSDLTIVSSTTPLIETDSLVTSLGTDVGQNIGNNFGIGATPNNTENQNSTGPGPGPGPGPEATGTDGAPEIPEGYSLKIEKSGAENNDQNIALITVTLTRNSETPLNENSNREFNDVLNSISLDVRGNSNSESELPESIEHNFEKLNPENGDNEISTNENLSTAVISFSGSKKEFPINIFAIAIFNEQRLISSSSVTISEIGAVDEDEIPRGYSLTIEKSGADNNDQGFAFVSVTLTRNSETALNDTLRNEFKEVLSSISLDVSPTPETEGEIQDAVEHDFEIFNSDTGEKVISTNGDISTSVVSFRGSKKSFSIDISAIGAFNEQRLISKESVTITGTGAEETAKDEDDDDEETPPSNDRCEVSIEQKSKGRTEIILTAIVKVKGEDGKFKTYPDEEGDLPKGATLAWYTPPVTEKKTETKARSRNMLSDDSGEKEKPNKEEKNKLKGLELDSRTVVIGDSGKARITEYPIRKPREDQTYGIKLDIPEVCSISNTVKIKGSAPAAGNNSSYKLHRDTGGHSPSGGFNAGQR